MGAVVPARRGGAVPHALAIALLWLTAWAPSALLGAPVARDQTARQSLGTLFRVEYPGRPASYLLGTLHSADPRVLAVAQRIAPVLREVRTLAIEAALGPGDRIAFFEAAQRQDGRALADVLGTETSRRVHERLDASMPAEVIDRLKPWAIFLKLAEDRAASDATLDAELLALARRRGIAVLGLELPEEQVAAFDTIPVASQIALVRYLTTSDTALATAHGRAIDAWLAGDLAGLAALAYAPGAAHPELAPHLAALEHAVIEGRTALFAHRLFVPLRAGRVLVAVGASHLAGERGLIALLRADGYRVRRVR